MKFGIIMAAVALRGKKKDIGWNLLVQVLE
jgi:hypothetical protein